MCSAAVVRQDVVFIAARGLFSLVCVLLTVAVHGQRCPALCVVTFVFNPDVFDLLFYCEQFSQ